MFLPKARLPEHACKRRVRLAKMASTGRHHLGFVWPRLPGAGMAPVGFVRPNRAAAPGARRVRLAKMASTGRHHLGFVWPDCRAPAWHPSGSFGQIVPRHPERVGFVWPKWRPLGGTTLGSLCQIAGRRHGTRRVRSAKSRCGNWSASGSFGQNGVHWARTALGSFGQIAGRWVRAAISVADFCCDRREAANCRIANFRRDSAHRS
jgi:hypothetical protein